MYRASLYKGNPVWAFCWSTASRTRRFREKVGARAREEWAHRFFSGGGTRTTFPSGAAATCLREENTRWMDRASSYVPCLGSCVCVCSLWGLSNNIRLLDDRHPAVCTRANAGAGIWWDGSRRGKWVDETVRACRPFSLLDGRLYDLLATKRKVSTSTTLGSTLASLFFSAISFVYYS